MTPPNYAHIHTPIKIMGNVKQGGSVWMWGDGLRIIDNDIDYTLPVFVHE